MNRADRVIIFSRVKKAVINILSSVFTAIETATDRNTVTLNGVKYVRASTLKMELRSIRTETLTQVRKLGEGYEQ
jgi:hypothetical protein